MKEFFYHVKEKLLYRDIVIFYKDGGKKPQKHLLSKKNIN
jgi:hypothetical protein